MADPAYQGDEPYAFVCYAHEDSDIVFAEMVWLRGQGINLWHDEGISAGTNWRAAIGDHLLGATHVLFYISQRSLTSDHCNREINLALDEGKDIIPVYLEDVDLTSDLKVGLNRVQAIHRFEIDEKEYKDKLSVALDHSPAATMDQLPTSKRQRFVVALALIVVVGMGGYILWPSGVSDDPTKASAEAEKLHNSIAVLPFANLSPDPDNAYFAAGVHEEILNQLAKIKDLSVIARTTMIRYANSDKSVPEIGDELNVSTVMEGSVRYAGNRVRITTQLIDATSGAHLWSEAYEEDLEDIFGIQLAIATRIADTLEAQLSPTQAAMADAVPTTNATSYAHFLRANSLMSVVNPIGPVYAELDLAIEADPQFAPAYASKAFLQALVLFPFPDRTPSRENIRISRVSARQNARRALDLDPNQARAWATLGFMAIEQSRFDEGTTLVEKSYALGPNDPLVLTWMQNVRVMQDRWNEFVSLSDKTIRLDPLNFSHFFTRSINAWWLERYDTAAEAAQDLIALQPDVADGYFLSAQAAAGMGDAQTAIENIGLALERNRSAQSSWVFANAASVFHQLGLEKEADEMIEQLAKLAVQQYVAPPIFLRAYLGSTDNGMVLRWLRAAIEEELCFQPCRNTIHLSKHSVFESVRDDPEFVALITGM